MLARHIGGDVHDAGLRLGPEIACGNAHRLVRELNARGA
jgi:hypothetical protein